MSRSGWGRRGRFGAVAIVLLAFVLRIYRLAELPPGLFYDEAFNALDGLAMLNDHQFPVFFAGNNGREPLFIYFQSLFILFSDTAPYVVRLPSVFLGTLTVAAAYPMFRRLLGDEDSGRRETTALVSTFLIATLEWHLNFSRIGFRAIAQPFFEVLVIYLFYRGAQALAEAAATTARQSSVPAGERARKGTLRGIWWLWFLLAGAALGGSLYTYLSARLLPVAVAALFALSLLWGRHLTRRYAVGFVLLVLAAIAVAAPLGRYYVQHPGVFVGHSEDVSILNFGGLRLLGENSLRLAGMFNWAGDVNWRHNLPERPVFDPMIGLFFLFGLVIVVRRLKCSWKRSSAEPSGYLVLAALVPVMLLPSLLSEGAPHFLRAIGIVPFVTLLPAIGIEATGRWLNRWRRVDVENGLGRTAAGFVVLSLLFSLGATYKGYFLDWGSAKDPYFHFDQAYVEFAEYVQTLDQSARLFLSPWLATHATAKLYLRQRPSVSLDSQRTIVLTPRDAVYAFQEGGVDMAASDSFPNALTLPLEVTRLPDKYGGRAFSFYRLPATASPASAEPEKALPPMFTGLERPAEAPGDDRLDFGDGLTLLGYSLTSAGEHDVDVHTVSAGITLPVTLVWRASQPLSEDYTASLRLVDAAGRNWGQADSLIGGPSYPSGRWEPWEIVADRPPLRLAVELPPGEYRLAIAVYSLASKTSREAKVGGVGRGDLATLGVVRVAKPAAGALAAMHPPRTLQTPLGSQVTLLGYGLSRESVNAGDDLFLDLFWKVTQDVDREFALELKVLDGRGQIVADRRSPPANGAYPTNRWRAGDALLDPQRLVVAAKAASGPSTIRVGLVDLASGALVGEASFPGPTLADRPHVFAAPQPQFPRLAPFADKVELLGFTVDPSARVETGEDLPQLRAKPGGMLKLRLAWRALAAMDVSYTVFVQLLDPQGRLVAQHDGLPAAGAAPTSSWLPQEVVVDPHAIVVRPDLPAGDYTLIAGLYNALDGKRLPVGAADFAKLAAVHLGAE